MLIKLKLGVLRTAPPRRPPYPVLPYGSGAEQAAVRPACINIIFLASLAELEKHLFSEHKGIGSNPI